MGKLVLLFVLAAAFGGALLTFSTRGLAGEAEGDRRNAQANVLARDLAQSVRAVVTGQMMGDDGFAPINDLGLTTRTHQGATVATMDYAGGVADVHYTPSPDRQTVDFTVTAFQEGAAHRVSARYAYDDVDFPTPLWLDVPYATAAAGSGSTVSGGDEDRAVAFDRSKFDQLGLGTLNLSTNTLASGIQSALNGARGDAAIEVHDAPHMARLPGMEDINVTSAEGLYFAAIDAMSTRGNDAVLTAGLAVSNNRSYGSAANPAIVRAPGGLSIANGGRVTGTGALVVEGPLTIANGGTLDWNGLVIVHTEEDYLPITFNGRATIDGALVVDQLGAPPGGHMDVSTFRNHATTGSTAWNPAYGDLTGSPFCGRMSGYRCPLFQHTHKFDLTPERNPRGKTVHFLGRDVTETQLRGTLSALGSRPVRLEVVNGETYSGMARYTMDVNGEETTGAVRLGFEQADGTYGTRTPAFRANELRDFDLEVRSLRMLRPLWDGTGSCDTTWPVCVGETRNRQRALTVRVIDDANPNRVFYEGAVYWHMQEGERAAHQAEEAAWRARIEAGADFGTRLNLGNQTTLTFDVDNIRLIGTRLGFDQPEHDLVTTSTQHWAGGEAGFPAMSTVPPSGPVTLCHARQTLMLPAQAAHAHVRHGDALGACDATPGPGNGGNGGPNGPGNGNGTPGGPRGGGNDSGDSGSGSSGSGGSGSGTGSGTTPTTPAPTTPAPTTPAPTTPPPMIPGTNIPSILTLCHSGTTMDVLTPQVLSHLFHGDRLGACAN